MARRLYKEGRRKEGGRAEPKEGTGGGGKRGEEEGDGRGGRDEGKEAGSLDPASLLRVFGVLFQLLF